MTFMKWVGCKSQLSNIIIDKINKINYTKYYEPFVGGGSILFKLEPKNAVISDLNWELINCYQQIKNNVKELSKFVDIHLKNHNKKYYLSIRNWDRTNEYSSIDNIKKASRIIYLVTTCYNGLYRVNKKNQFNTPIGTNQNYDLKRLVKCSNYLNNNNCIIRSCSFSNYKTDNFCNSFFYLDPPYYSEDNSIYNNYTINGFKESDQETLKRMCDYIDAKRGYFLLSNSNTSFIKQLYNRYDIKEVVTKRKISSKRSSRGDVVELLISNY